MENMELKRNVEKVIEAGNELADEARNIVIEKGLCPHEDCPLPLVFNDLSDEELSGAIKVICRAKYIEDGGAVILAHLVSEQLTRSDYIFDKVTEF